MKYLNKTIEYGLYLLVFLLPLETRWIIKAGQLNGGYWEYGTYSLYATDILLIIVLLLFIVREIPRVKHGAKGAAQQDAKLLAMIEKKELDCGSESAMTEKRIHNGKKIWWFVGGLILASAVSVAFSADKFLALYKFGWLILGVGLFWLIRSADYDRLKLIYALLASAFLQAGLAVWQFLNQTSFVGKWLGLALHDGADLGASVIEAVGADGIGERWLRAYGGLDHPNILGGLLAVAILLLIGEILRKNHSECPNKLPIPITNVQINCIYWVCLVTFTAGLFFSFSRSAWLALAAGLAALIVWAVAAGNYKAQRDLAETVLVMGIIIFIFFNQYENLITARLNGEGRLEAKSNFERLASYQEAWQVIKNNWLFGVGPGNYTLVLYDKITPGQANYYYQPTHNVFMLVWAETGILGIIFFVGTIISFLILNFKFEIINYRKRAAGGNNLKVNTAVLVVIIALMSLDHWLWSLHFGVWFFWLVLGLTAGDKRNEKLISI